MGVKSPRTRAIESIISNLERDLEGVQREIRLFKDKHAKLVIEQTILKRKRGELHRLIKALKDNVDVPQPTNDRS